MNRIETVPYSIVMQCGEPCWWLGFMLTAGCTEAMNHDGPHRARWEYRDRDGGAAHLNLEWTGRVAPNTVLEALP